MKKYIPEIESSSLSVVGPVREDNQDSIRLSDDDNPTGPGLLFALADGMGGYSHGALASLLALESFSSVLALQNGSGVVKTLQRAVETANLRVYQKAQQMRAGRMGTTLTAAYVFGDMLYLAHVGDSRAYLIRDGQCICLTADHTTVGEMVRSKLITADKVRTHAQRSILTKSVGIDLFVQPDIIQQRLRVGDRLVLCSDGVWSVIEDDELAQVASRPVSMDVLSQNLIELALQNQTDDNASVVVFHLHKLHSQEDDGDAQSTNWFGKLRKLVS